MVSWPSQEQGATLSGPDKLAVGDGKGRTSQSFPFQTAGMHRTPEATPRSPSQVSLYRQKVPPKPVSEGKYLRGPTAKVTAPPKHPVDPRTRNDALPQVCYTYEDRYKGLSLPVTAGNDDEMAGKVAIVRVHNQQVFSTDLTLALRALVSEVCSV